MGKNKAQQEVQKFEKRRSPLGNAAVKALKQMVEAVDSPARMRELAPFHGDRPGTVRHVAAYLFDDAVVADAFEHYCTHIGKPSPFGVMLEEWCDKLLERHSEQEHFKEAKTHFMDAFKLIADRVEYLFNQQMFGMFMSARPRGIRKWMTKKDRAHLNCCVENGFYQLLMGLDSVE